MKRSTKKILRVFFILWLIYFMFKKKNTVEGFTMEQKTTVFNNFMDNHYSTIFPDGGRNAGGPMFYHYFVNNMNLDRDHFKLYNQFYCGVSGSIVSPNRSGGNISNHVVLEDISGDQWFGKYYRCCVPCLCDIMRYAKVEKHTVQLTDGPYEHHVITIDDPCSNPTNIPPQVSSFTCSNGMTFNGERTSSGRLIIAVLYGPDENPEEPIHYDSTVHTIDGDQYCNGRICQDPTELQGGMGDIFVLLSLAGNNNTPPPPERFSCSGIIERFENTDMLNIYGEPLEKCREDTNSSDQRGSWDSNGYCSELGGGVHQICFDVNHNTKEFSNQTGQSNWSLNREGKNHCMCLGAWALYKAKQENNIIPETINELKCESIPEISLTDNYINHWNTWNGNELPDQIVQGVNKLVEQCYHKENIGQEKKGYLQQKYLELVEGKTEFIGKILSF